MKLVVILFLLAVSQINAETIQEELVRLTNEYRAEYDLPAIPMSYQLTKVAIIHTHDMATGGAIGGECNLHSWSNNGYGLWNGCCYTSNHAAASCMWDKPREISGGIFTGNGYENSASGTTTAAGALALWKASSGHNDVILNKNTWASMTWRALGASVCGSNAVLWFSDTADTSSGNPADLTCQSVVLPSAPSSSPINVVTPTAGNTPTTSNSPATSNSPSAGPSSSNTPSNNINKPSSGHANAAALIVLAVSCLAMLF